MIHGCCAGQRILIPFRTRSSIRPYQPDYPLNSTFVDSANGAPVFQTESHNVARRVTSLGRFMPHLGVFQNIAEIHWENLSFHAGHVIYKGQKILLTDYLRRQGHFFFTFRKVFIAADGREYKWKVNSSLKFRLYDDADNEMVESHNKHVGIIRKTQDASLDISPSGFPILDDIVLSFIIANHLERQNRAARENQHEISLILNE